MVFDFWDSTFKASMIFLMDIIQQQSLKVPLSVKNAQNGLYFKQFAVYQLPDQSFWANAELRQFAYLIDSCKLISGSDDNWVQIADKVVQKGVFYDELVCFKFWDVWCYVFVLCTV